MKAKFDLGKGCELSYRVDDFTDPWRPAQTVVLVHGLAESADAWYGWVPTLSRNFRVVRVDLRGFGESTPMERDFSWSLDLLADDLAAFIGGVCKERVHLVGAKIGATICMRFAARHPDLLTSLTVIGLPVKGSANRPGLDPEVHGVRKWARSSMEERLGEAASPEMLEWWSDLMGRTAKSTLLGFSQAVATFDVSDDLERVSCPVLVINSDSARHPVAAAEKWRSRLQDSELVVIPGEGYHAAAVYPDLCAKALAEFIGNHPAANG